jgi:hypothetical protein
MNTQNICFFFKVKSSNNECKENIITYYLKYIDSIITTCDKVPGTRLSGNIIPIFKNKGKSDDPKNYRPISILSCLGKLFTSILNKRLNAYLYEFLFINESQIGFRQCYSTNDNIFSLHSLFELLTLKKKKMFCVFIDFEKSLRYCLGEKVYGVNHS